MTKVQAISWLAENVFGPYFHPEWPMEFASTDDVITHIVQVSPVSELAKIADSLESLLANHSNDELTVLLPNALDCSYDPTEQGLTASQWLTTLAQRFQQKATTLSTNELATIAHLVGSNKYAHTIDLHVGKSADELQAAQKKARYPYHRLSSFPNLTLAEECTATVFQYHTKIIEQLAPEIPHGQQFPSFGLDLGKPMGITMDQQGQTESVTGGRLLLIRDEAESMGCVVFACYPAKYQEVMIPSLDNHEMYLVRELLGGYFFQYWVDFYQSPLHATVDFLRQRNPAKIADVDTALKKLIDSKLSETELQLLLTSHFGCEYQPESITQWLNNLRTTIQAWQSFTANYTP